VSDPSPTPRPPSRPLREDEWVALIVALVGFGAMGLGFALRPGDGAAGWLGDLGRDRAVPAIAPEEGETAAGVTNPNRAEFAPFPKPTATPPAAALTVPPQSGAEGRGGGDGNDPDRLGPLNPAAIAAAQSAAQTTTTPVPGAEATDPTAAPTPEVSPAPPPVPTFEDVPEGHWARPFVTALAQQRIVAGFEDGRFLPDEPVTRAQFASLITAAFGDRPDAAPSKTFADIPADYWGNTAIARAVQLGFMKGYPDGNFQPDRPIPRLELAVALSTGLQLAAPDAPQTILGQFTDGTTTPAWAAPKLAAAASRRLFNNYPDPQRLDLAAIATRAQVAVSLYQTQVLLDLAPAIDSPYLSP
jgi:hypothetical protein